MTLLGGFLDSPQAGGIVKSGLVAWYDFYDGSGQSVPEKYGGTAMQNGSTGTTDVNDFTFASPGAIFGTDDYAKVTGTFTGSSPFTVCVVAAWPGAAGIRYIHDGSADGKRVASYIISNVLMMNRGTQFSTGLTVPKTNAFVAHLIYNGANSKAILNSTASSTGNVGTDTPDFITLGNSYGASPSLGWPGTLYHWLIYAGAMSDANCQRNYAYFKKLMAARGVTVA